LGELNINRIICRRDLGELKGQVGTIPSEGQNLQFNKALGYALQPIRRYRERKISSSTHLYKYLIPRRDSKVWPNISCAAVA